jgi:hypothetical protein
MSRIRLSHDSYGMPPLPALRPVTLAQVLTHKSFHNRTDHPSTFEASSNDPPPDNEMYLIALYVYIRMLM